MPSDVRDSIERGWRQLVAIDEALEQGEIDEPGWHAAVAAIVVPAYLAGETPWQQSGKSGDLASWERGRRPIMAAVDRNGTFLDVGCANGFLMESVRTWGAEDGRDVEPYGLENSPELAALGRRRLPAWADRIFVVNAGSGSRHAASTSCARGWTTPRPPAAASWWGTYWSTSLLPEAA
jgi:hypothetical protein